MKCNYNVMQKNTDELKWAGNNGYLTTQGGDNGGREAGATAVIVAA